MKITKKRKRKSIGKGTDKDVSLSKEIDILNYHPVGYKYSQQWADFNKNAENYFRQSIAKMNIDDLCDEMFDSLIDAELFDMIASAKEQYAFHFETINHIRGMVKGQIHKAEGKKELINSDIERYDDELQKYQTLKDNLNIY